jgi:hypothetical protein
VLLALIVAALMLVAFGAATNPALLAASAAGPYGVIW